MCTECPYDPTHVPAPLDSVMLSVRGASPYWARSQLSKFNIACIQPLWEPGQVLATGVAVGVTGVAVAVTGVAVGVLGVAVGITGVAVGVTGVGVMVGVVVPVRVGVLVGVTM